MIRSSATKPAELVNTYVTAVENGTRPAGHFERLAVERYLRDLDQAASRGFYLDRRRAAHAVDAFPSLFRHSIGQFLGEPFELLPWQAFVVWNIFGWIRPDDKTRRFRRAYVTVGRKNGKSTLAAGLALFFMLLDREPGSHVYLAATKEQQSRLIFDEARRMVESSPALSEIVQCRIDKLIAKEAPWHESFIRPVGADGNRQDGLNPHCVIKDEVHAWSEALRDLDDKLSTGGAARRQAFELMITTAGSEQSLIWLAKQREFEQVLEQDALDDTSFALIFAADKGDQLDDERAWQKANPSFGVSVSRKYLEAQLAETKLNPDRKLVFERYHLNRRTHSFTRMFDREAWDQCSAEYDPPERAPCIVGLDLGRTDDWASVVAVFPYRLEGEREHRFGIKSHSWAATGQDQSKINYSAEPFATWIREGHLSLNRSGMIDYSEIQDHIAELREKYRIREVAYDKTFAGELVTALDRELGLKVLDFYQTFKRFNEPILSMNRALAAGKISHGGDPCLAWQAGNAEAIEDKQGRLMIRKGNLVKRSKIDAIVALLMAYGEAIYFLNLRKVKTGFVT